MYVRGRRVNTAEEPAKTGGQSIAGGGLQRALTTGNWSITDGHNTERDREWPIVNEFNKQ